MTSGFACAVIAGHQNAVCEKSQAVAHRISLPGDAVQPYNIGLMVNARSRGNGLRPGLVRAAPQTCSGGRFSSPAARCLEAETASSQIAPPRSAVLHTDRLTHPPPREVVTGQRILPELKSCRPAREMTAHVRAFHTHVGMSRCV